MFKWDQITLEVSAITYTVSMQLIANEANAKNTS